MGGELLLSEIQNVVQQIAEAISSVLGIDATIVDENLERVAGTGKYRNLVGNRIPKDSVFEQSLRDKRAFIIDQPKIDHACSPCESKNSCAECGTICTPILVNGEAKGIIGLAAFNQDQRLQFERKREDYLSFLNKMASLISAKINEQRIFNDLLFANRQVETTIEALPEAILTVDDSGKLRLLNQAAKILLETRGKESPLGKDIGVLLPEMPLADLIGSGKRPIDQKVVFSDHGRTYHFLCSGTPILSDGRILGAVIVLKDFNSLYRSVIHIEQRAEMLAFEDIIGMDENFLAVKEQARVAARSDSTVLITGESGTGKELFARAIHTESLRRQNLFMAINCSAIPELLLESELFGYEEGAFTGAKKGGKFGKFEVADGGTIFLDEMGDMPLHLQAKLLRFLEEKKLMRLGGHKHKEVDVRVISSTNRDLFGMTQGGSFRSDLYYRLNVIPIRIPPLRERKGDIPLFLNFFLQKYNRLLHKSIEGFTFEVEEVLLTYNWPGNVRELQNLVEYVVNFESSSTVRMVTLPPRFREEMKLPNRPLREIVDRIEKEEIQKALERFPQGSEGMGKTARFLGISRATLYRKVKRIQKKG